MTRSLPIAQVLRDADDAATLAVAGTANVYGKSFSLGHGISFALILTATSDGAVDLDVYVQESDVVPTTEGASDTNWVVPENVSKLIDITDETRHIIAFSPVVCRYARLYVDGQGSNHSSTVLAAKLVIIEDV